MQLNIFFALLVLLLSSGFANQITDRCAKFDGAYGLPLVECPPAKFMIKDDLFECYDKNYREQRMYMYYLAIDF